MNPADELVNWFDVLSSVDCRGHTEEKNGYTYLSWPWCVQMMTHYDPCFDWGLNWFQADKDHGPQPYLIGPAGVFVQVWATFQGKKVVHLYPVLDFKNNPVPADKVNSFDINTSQMRGMVKACALHGLGIYIFMGEKQPGGADNEAMIAANKVRALLEDDLEEAVMAEQCYKLHTELNENQDLFLQAWHHLGPGERRAFKAFRLAHEATMEAARTGEERK